MVVADLHVHTTNSDGTVELADLPGLAAAADLEAVAVTDHDRIHPDLAAPVTERDGVTVVHGIELQVAAGDARVDLLGYGLRRTDALVETVEALQADRVERGRAIVENLEDHLGIELDVAIEPGLGRPDVARAVADHPETDLSVQDVFDEYVHDGGPLYVARDVPTFERARRILGEACAVVGLAHPLRYDDPEAALALAADLDAIELYYPYESAVDLAPVERIAHEHDLLVTGGSDAHEADLGGTGLGADEWEAVRARLDA